MKIIDISWPIEEKTTVAPGEQPIVFEPTKTFTKDNSREHHIIMNAHTGTHVDAPSYILRDGKTIDELDFYDFTGPATIIDVTSCTTSIKKEDLHDKTINEGDIILLKTRNSQIDPTAPYDPNFTYLDASAAKYLAEKKIKTLGFDYITCEQEKDFERTHKILIDNNIILIEGLQLYMVTPGQYLLLCLPIYTLGIEAAPARAVLLDTNGNTK